MGFLDKLFGTKENLENEIQDYEQQHEPENVHVGYPEPEEKEVFLDLSKNTSLDLTKNNFLNLSKTDINLNNLRLAAGWDVNTHWGESDYDLDLCAYLFSNGVLNDTVFFNHMNASGVSLDGDNRTGEGDGDDENIYINLNSVRPSIDKIVLGVVIYEAFNRNQHFGKVKNAYVRLVDESVDKEILRYNLSGEGNKKVAVEMAEIYRTNGNWNFKALGKFHGVGSVRTLGKEIEKNLR